MAAQTTTVTPRRGVESGEQSKLEPRWHVVLLDDNDHTYAYVIQMLGAIFGYGPEKAYTLARIVDVEGRAVVATSGYGRALDYQGQIHSFGADPLVPRCRGSMTAVLEPAG